MYDVDSGISAYVMWSLSPSFLHKNFKKIILIADKVICSLYLGRNLAARYTNLFLKYPCFNEGP